jgi:hypothetical protein
MPEPPTSFVAPPPVRTSAERAVAETLAAPGVHVVHFWAPWCRNSVDELEAWRALLSADRPEATYTFVTVWDNGASGRSAMDEAGIPGDVAEVVQPDLGPSGIKGLRRKQFLDLPVTWIPTTWVFRGDALAYALNYGEASEHLLRTVVADAGRSW